MFLILYNIKYIDKKKLYRENFENKNFLYTSKQRQFKKNIFFCRFMYVLSLNDNFIT